MLGVACATQAAEPSGFASPETSPSGEPNPIAAPTGEPRITAEIPVPYDAYNLGVAVGAGSAWVGLEPKEQNREDSVIRIDLATNEIVAEIPVAEAPSYAAGPRYGKGHAP